MAFRLANDKIDRVHTSRQLISGLVQANQELVVPRFETLNGIPTIKGGVAYDNSSGVLAYSNGSLWIPLLSNLTLELTPENFITVHPTFQGADFTNIKDALAFATTLLPTRSAVMVYPSTYIEDNPLIVPNTISVIGLSGPLGATVVALNTGSILFDIGNGCVIQNLTMFGGSIGIRYDGSTGSQAGSIVRACVIIDTAIGIRSFTGPGELFCVETLVRSALLPVVTGFECITGGKMRCFTAGTFGLPLNNVGTGVKCDGLGSQLVYFSSSFQLCDVAVLVDNNARLEIKASFVRDSDVALRVGAIGNSLLLVDSATILNSLIYDLDILATTGNIQIYGGTLRTDLINNPNNVIIFSNSFSAEPFNEAQQILGQLHVGSALQPTSASIGEGDTYTRGMVVLTDDGTSTNFMNITASAKNPFVATPFLQGLGVGNVIYIGGSATLFYGFNTDVTLAWAVGDSDKTAKEYWNGVAWTPLPIMVTKELQPYSSRTDVLLENIEKQNIRFGKTTGWTTTVVDSITAFWIRIRVTALLTGPIPTVNGITLHPSFTKTNNDGFLEFFGDARPVKLIPWDLGQLEPAASSPADQDIFISDNLDIGRTENLFNNGATDRSGFNTFLPREIDTSYGAKFRWAWRSTATGGSIDWVLRWGWTNDGFDVYPTQAAAPPVGVNEQSMSFSTAVVNAIGTQVTESRILSIPKVNARPVSSNNPDMLWITIQRTAGDTHTGNVALIQVQGEYVAFCSGGHVTVF